MDAVTNLPEIRGAGDNLSPADLISPVMKGPRRTANPTTRAVLGQSNLSNCTPAAEEVECLPGTPKLYESVQVRACVGAPPGVAAQRHVSPLLPRWSLFSDAVGGNCMLSKYASGTDLFVWHLH